MSEKRKSTRDQADEYRRKVAESFLHLLDTDNPVNSFDWVKGWQSLEMPYSITSDVKYSGINAYHLFFTAIANDWKDPRWVTFNGLKKYPGAHVNKGEHGTQIQRWMVNDTTKRSGEKGKFISFEEMYKLIDNGRDPDEFRSFPKYYYVFNAEQCTGLPERPERSKNEEVDEDLFVTTVAKNLNVDISHDGGYQAYYRPSDDTIHLPEKDSFYSSYEYNSTALHELAHSTGADKRLNRSIVNGFADDQYAFEELVAEMTSCMTSSVLKRDEESMDAYIKKHAENHYRYIKSWAQHIEKDPKCLENALKLASVATDYIDLAGGIISLKEFHTRQKDYAVQLNDDGSIKATINKTALLSKEPVVGIPDLPGKTETMKKGLHL